MKKQLWSLSRKAQRLSERRRTEIQRAEITNLLASFAVVLPLSAFTYWRILLEKFNTDYFEFCYTFDDVYYILYYKGTVLWYTLTVLMLSAVISATALHFWKFHLQFVTTGLVCLLTYILCNISHFNHTQTIILMIISICITIAYLFFTKHAQYLFVVFSGIFLICAASADAKYYQKAARKKDIQLKDGSFVLKKSDTECYYVTSTSKYILIYTPRTHQIKKIERDQIR
ncbi:hypothetical protein [Flavobacterium sp. CFS9]|uniref:hypothetical protein n=1 Tax=Flavobacterium sp. CFS9 TaxID=3143118 RepID=UPI0034E8DAC7